MYVDTRQQADKHRAKHDAFERAGYRLVRTKLYVGDYQLPRGGRAVDTKRSIQELAMDVQRDHERFRREMLKALDVGMELWVLTENRDGVRSLADLERWEEAPRDLLKRKGGGARPIDGAALAKACRTMHERYGARFAFCRPDMAGAAVMYILESEEEGKE